MTIITEGKEWEAQGEGSTLVDFGVIQPEAQPTHQLAVSISELALLTGLSESLLYTQANANDLPGCRRIGQRFLVSLGKFMDWLDEGMGAGDQPPALVQPVQTQLEDKNIITVSIPKLSEITGISAGTLYRRAKDGSLPGCRRLGDRIVVHLETFIEYMRSGKGSDNTD